MRVMYWPNEAAHLYPGFQQKGGRSAFEAMAADGTIAALAIYSYRVERARYPDRATFETAALEAIAAFAPDILFVQHVGGSGLGESFWQGLARQARCPTVAYHEGDVFGRWIKRLDACAIAALRHADIVLACGLGAVERLYRRHTAAPIRLMPHAFPAAGFAALDPAAAHKTAQLAMIGNRGHMRRVPGMYMPGGRRRARLARRLAREYGRDFALYGHGWEGLPSARGPVPFFEQEAAIQAAPISVNWDHFDTINSYFSDRLPISLAAGVPHVTTWHPGYDELFADCPGLYACQSVGEVVDTCRRLLARPDRELLEEGLAARAWALAHLEARPVFRRGLEQAAAVHAERR